VLNNVGTFNVTAGGDFTQNFGNAGHAINNSGTWNVSGEGTRSYVSGIAFNNSGTVNVTSGTLDLSGGGIATGTFAISSGATLLFAGNGYSLFGATLTGLGQARLESGVSGRWG
jgi:hypothetical protein